MIRGVYIRVRCFVTVCVCVCLCVCMCVLTNDDQKLQHNYHNNDNVWHVVDEQYDMYDNIASSHAFLNSYFGVTSKAVFWG